MIRIGCNTYLRYKTANLEQLFIEKRKTPIYYFLGGRRAHVHVAPTSKMDVFCSPFSSSSSS